MTTENPLENERIADFEHRIRRTQRKDGPDAIVEANDEIIDMLLAQVSGNDLDDERKVNKLTDKVPYMHYNGVIVTHLGWTPKVEQYLDTDWEALKHPGDSVAKSGVTG